MAACAGQGLAVAEPLHRIRSRTGGVRDGQRKETAFREGHRTGRRDVEGRRAGRLGQERHDYQRGIHHAGGGEDAVRCGDRSGGSLRVGDPETVTSRAFLVERLHVVALAGGQSDGRGDEGGEIGVDVGKAGIGVLRKEDVFPARIGGVHRVGVHPQLDGIVDARVEAVDPAAGGGEPSNETGAVVVRDVGDGGEVQPEQIGRRNAVRRVREEPGRIRQVGQPGVRKVVEELHRQRGRAGIGEGGDRSGHRVRGGGQIFHAVDHHAAVGAEGGSQRQDDGAVVAEERGGRNGHDPAGGVGHGVVARVDRGQADGLVERQDEDVLGAEGAGDGNGRGDAVGDGADGEFARDDGRGSSGGHDDAELRSIVRFGERRGDEAVGQRAGVGNVRPDSAGRVMALPEVADFGPVGRPGDTGQRGEARDLSRRQRTGVGAGKVVGQDDRDAGRLVVAVVADDRGAGEGGLVEMDRATRTDEEAVRQDEVRLARACPTGAVGGKKEAVGLVRTAHPEPDVRVVQARGGRVEREHGGAEIGADAVFVAVCRGMDQRGLGQGDHLESTGVRADGLTDNDAGLGYGRTLLSRHVQAFVGKPQLGDLHDHVEISGPCRHRKVALVAGVPQVRAAGGLLEVAVPESRR